MNLQFRITLGLALLAAIAIGTGSVLLFGYFMAAASLTLLLVVVTRKGMERLQEARSTRRRTFPRSPEPRRESSGDGDLRRAA